METAGWSGGFSFGGPDIWLSSRPLWLTTIRGGYVLRNTFTQQ